MSNQDAQIAIPVTDTMMEAAEILKERLTKRRYDELIESMIHLVSTGLTDADFNIVDADPVDDSTRYREVAP